MIGRARQGELPQWEQPEDLATAVGEVDLAGPRDRAGSFEPRLVPKGARRAGGLGEVITALYAGVTVREARRSR